MDLEELIRIHQKSRYNKEKLQSIGKCACFHCKSKFPTVDIKEWTDGGKTAICPKCKVDSVIPITPDCDIEDKLDQLHDLYFS
jgi:hypothetical protein